ncbi:single strand DNA binding protein [Acinetobacter phage vB_AbaSi_W9]|nr:single strand DNA binding protein [Acinetobacter phage vB_AbaSi_W9]
MAKLIAAFNPQQYDPTQGAAMLPVGRHRVVITNSEVKPTADNANGYVQFDVQIIDGDLNGVTGAYRLNLYHSSPQASEIAHRRLSALCHVCGVLGSIQDTAQLHNIPFMIEVVKQTKGEGAEKGYTEVSKVFDANGNEPKQGGNSAAAVAQNAGQTPPNGNGGAWGGQQQGGFNTANNVPVPQDNNNQGGFGGQQQGNGGAWGGQQNNQQQGNQQGGAPAWGGGQQQGNQQQNNGGQPSWGGGQGNGNAPAWGQG